MAISPGTWRVSGTREVYSDALPRENCVVAEILDGSDEDATLIAAAPVMLKCLRVGRDALIELYEQAYPDDESDNDITKAIDLMRDVIAAAEGRTE